MGGLEKKIDVNTIVGVVSFKTRQKDQQVCMPFFFKIIIINYLKTSRFFMHKHKWLFGVGYFVYNDTMFWALRNWDLSKYGQITCPV